MTKDIFKRGEYIVLTEEIKHSSNFKKDYIYKQKESFTWLRPEKDIEGSGSNGHTEVMANSNTNWRFAYAHERKAYDEVNKPVNVKDSVFKEGDYVKVLQDLYGYQKGDIGVVVRKAGSPSESIPTYVVFVPNSKSTSAQAPNVIISIRKLERSSVEEYNKANNVKPEVQGSIEGKVVVITGKRIASAPVGWLFKALETKGFSNNAYYKYCHSISPNNFRLATERETIAYEAGVTNINTPELIEGVFYKHENGSILLWGDGDSSYYINPWKKPHKGRGRYIIDSSKFVLATEEEIAPLLKFIHEDKLKDADMKPGIDSFDDSDTFKGVKVTLIPDKLSDEELINLTKVSPAKTEDFEETFSSSGKYFSTKKQTRAEKMKDLMVSLKPIKSRII